MRSVFSSELAITVTTGVLWGAVTACVPNIQKAGGASRRTEVAVWELPPEATPPTLSLIPAGSGTPRRMKRGLATVEQSGRLSARVDGKDPALSWDLASPLGSSVANVVVEASAPGPLQLFWATRRCPVFSEPCSAIANLSAGRNVVSFELDPGDPLRSVRLDPPDQLGEELLFHEIHLRADGVVEAPWVPRDTVDRQALDSRGLELFATGTDPGVTTATPGLDAARVTSVEVTLRGPSGSTPQLFWDGPCGFFAEACSALLGSADAGALTHRAVLRASPRWTGRISTLRLDPGSSAGEYVVEHIALVHNPGD